MTIASQMQDALTLQYVKIPHDKAVSPRFLANAVIAELKPPEGPDWGAYIWGLSIALVQMARGICRRRFEDEQREAESSAALYDFKLQPRYPEKHGLEVEAEDVRYLPLDMMTIEDWDYNIERMSAEISTKTLHRDAMIHERDTRIRRGTLKPTAPKEAQRQRQFATKEEVTA